MRIARAGRLFRHVSIFMIMTGLLACACGSGASRGTQVARPSPVASAGPSAGRLANPPPLPSDLTLLTLVTKQRGLGPTYQPADLEIIPPEYVSSSEPQPLRRPATDALIKMLAAAARDGFGIKVNSAYRSYDTQVVVFRSEVATYGCTQALRESAVAGYSEHQLGLAVDLTSLDVGWDLQESFAKTPEGRWLAQHAADYGFVLSYPLGKEGITGYEYEPWHYRYVTEPFAKAIAASGKTPTEYLEALGYPSSTITTPTPSSGPPSKPC